MSSVFDREILSDYVDGRLDDDARVSVAVHLAENPEDAAIVEQYRSHGDQLRLAAESILHEPVPDRFREIVRTASAADNIELLDTAYSRGSWAPWQIAASVAVILFFVAGAFGIGWMARGQQETAQLNSLLVQQFVRSASDAYLLYDLDTDRQPAVRTERMKEFVAWLYDTFGDDFTPPGLDAEGFEFSGGRLLPSTTGHAAQMIYTGTDNRRVTLYFVKSEPDNPIESALNLVAETVDGFQTYFVQDDNRSIYVWDRAPARYALVAEMERQDLSDLTKGVLARLHDESK